MERSDFINLVTTIEIKREVTPKMLSLIIREYCLLHKKPIEAIDKLLYLTSINTQLLISLYHQSLNDLYRHFNVILLHDAKKKLILIY